MDVIKDLGDWGNWAALGVDLVFAVVPFAPSGAGQVIKVGNKIDNVADVAIKGERVKESEEFSNLCRTDLQRTAARWARCKIIDYP